MRPRTRQGEQRREERSGDGMRLEQTAGSQAGTADWVRAARGRTDEARGMEEYAAGPWGRGLPISVPGP